MILDNGPHAVCVVKAAVESPGMQQDLSNQGRQTLSQPQSKPLVRLVTGDRSEEHTSELQSQSNLVCRLLLEKKKKIQSNIITARCLRHVFPFTHGHKRSRAIHPAERRRRCSFLIRVCELYLECSSSRSDNT